MSRPGIEPGSQDLASCAITARPPQHDTTGPRAATELFDVFQGSCYTILLPSARHSAWASTPSSATSVTGIQLESGAREETGKFRDVKRCVATGDRTRGAGFSLLRHNGWTTAARYHRTAPQSLLTCFRVPVTPCFSESWRSVIRVRRATFWMDGLRGTIRGTI